jgi:hypothetical protein
MSSAPFVFLGAGGHLPRRRLGAGAGAARRRAYTADPATLGNGYAEGMCRNIRTLHNFEPPATHDEVAASALQYVRKISGFTKPSKANEAAFAAAVQAVTEVSVALLEELTTAAPPKNREAEAAKARARSAA